MHSSEYCAAPKGELSWKSSSSSLLFPQPEELRGPCSNSKGEKPEAS
uniref:Uncharacterized protein n=1 Tax=Trichinella nativa TaxID=6335 RepID=A0A0V1KI22_9BILA